MHIFGETLTGEFAKVNLSTGNSRGSTLLFPDNEGSPIDDSMVIVDFQMDQTEALTHQRGLDKKMYTYTFGNEVGRCTVTALVYTGTCGDASRAGYGLPEVLGAYSKSRVSQSKMKVVLAIGLSSGSPIEGQLTGMSINTKNAEMGLLSVTFTLSMTTVAEY